ncbi:hypothetical protein Vadar_002830 [Vaccinium darrowii]|uniref:Uncharacterized protein n=1 Tax=Vaccinium darrowii TaxID=229202 RepID=A0ACB7XF91_9ERIC|nr:hypothetical protein Vadar_002830 [Vaccinium darrowii]
MILLSWSRPVTVPCHDAKAGGVIGKLGSSRHEAAGPRGENANDLAGLGGVFLFIDERILESDVGGYVGGKVDVAYRQGRGSRVATSLVASRMHVGSLLGK